MRVALISLLLWAPLAIARQPEPPADGKLDSRPVGEVLNDPAAVGLATGPRRAAAQLLHHYQGVRHEKLTSAYE